MQVKRLKLHHVVLQALCQLLMSFHSEVETICCEEAQVKCPILKLKRGNVRKQNILFKKRVCECDVQEVLVVLRSLNKVAEQQQSPL